MISIQIVLSLSGTILWFVGPVFARRVPSEGAAFISTPSFWDYIADDVLTFKVTDRLQVIGVTLLVSALVLGLPNWPYVIPWVIVLPPTLWLTRTVFYFNRWTRFDNPLLDLPSAGWLIKLFKYRGYFVKFFRCAPEINELIENHLKTRKG